MLCITVVLSITFYPTLIKKSRVHFEGRGRFQPLKTGNPKHKKNTPKGVFLEV